MYESEYKKNIKREVKNRHKKTRHKDGLII
jgi:hypothetical protein